MGTKEALGTDRSIITLCASTLLLLAVGCGTGRRPVDDRVTDAVIASTVRQRLAQDDLLARAAIDVAVTAGVVTLTGRVPREKLRLRAQELARRVDGVREVRNLIRVHGRGG